MNDLTFAVAGGCIVLAAVIAYLLGRRSRPAAAKASNNAPSPPTPTRGDGAAPTAVAASTAPPKPKRVDEPKLPSLAPPPGSIDALDYEDDANVEPTRVGATAAPTVKPIYQAPLKRIEYDEDAAIDEPTKSQSMFLIHGSAQTDRGLKRKRNEDALLVDPTNSLFVIADGMGGHQGGQVASQLAVSTIADAYRENRFEGPAHDGVPADATNLARAIQMGNAAIHEASKQDRTLSEMGTTICAARFSTNKKRLFIGHVGDSRCYRLRGSSFVRMTADHTMAEFGVTGSAGDQLSRAVGIWPVVPIDMITAAPEFEDVYLLCSDGLTKMMSDEAIGAVVATVSEPKAAVEQLIARANERGGKDNITVIVVRVVSPHSDAPGS
jgi:protein phosphatase